MAVTSNNKVSAKIKIVLIINSKLYGIDWDQIRQNRFHRGQVIDVWNPVKYKKKHSVRTVPTLLCHVNIFHPIKIDSARYDSAKTMKTCDLQS